MGAAWNSWREAYQLSFHQKTGKVHSQRRWQGPADCLTHAMFPRASRSTW
jgi:hypothetical protein